MNEQKMKTTRKNDVFLGVDGFLYKRGSASVQNFQEPLIDLWQEVHAGKQPSTIDQGATVWERDALLVMAKSCGRTLRLDKPEEYGLPDGGTYADLAATIDERLKGLSKAAKH